MTKTTCDICGKEMSTTKSPDTIRSLNFCISSNGRIWDICNECRADLNRWMATRRIESENDSCNCLNKIMEELSDTGAYEKEVNGHSDFLDGISYCLVAMEKYKAEKEE